MLLKLAWYESSFYDPIEHHDADAGGSSDY